MKQILQGLDDGATEIVEVPAPVVRSNEVLIASRTSLISAGTERMLLEFGKAGWLDKARQQPEKVKQVLEKVGTDGVLATYEAVMAKLGTEIPLGYSNVGVVQAVGFGATGLSPGDRVVSNGSHAELVCVPRNLCARIPESVNDEQAAFAVLGAISLQGVRLAAPTLGECVVVTGCGLLGLLTVQLLRAQGCRVLAIDIADDKLDLAAQFGAVTCNAGKDDDPVAVAHEFSRGSGVDAVIITASTRSSDPVSQAARMCRKRGRIVLVGVTGLELNRADFYKKELTFQVSCSYGPGRYDPEYEAGGHDYPIGYVRWTEQRNFEAVLDLMAAGKLNVTPLITHRFAFEEAPTAYDVLAQGKSALGILLQYSHSSRQSEPVRRVQLADKPSGNPERPIIGFIGAGNYAGRTLIPAFRNAGASLHTIASARGLSATIQGRKAGFAFASSDAAEVFESKQINTVVISTQHDSHAGFVVDALQRKKHVFVEKPLCLTIKQLAEVQHVFQKADSLLAVGFNRRFAPQVVKIKQLLGGGKSPVSMVMTVNAGAIPPDHWTQDKAKGGGRIIGEACHFVDLLRFLADAEIVGHSIHQMAAQFNDTASIQLQFANGSIGTIHYFANGSRAYSKERLEVFSAGRVLQLDNFRKLKGYGWPGFSSMNLWRQDKGQNALVKAFVDAVEKGGPPPIPVDEIFEVSRVCVELAGQHASD